MQTINVKQLLGQAATYLEERHKLCQKHNFLKANRCYVSSYHIIIQVLQLILTIKILVERMPLVLAGISFNQWTIDVYQTQQSFRVFFYS